MALQPLQTEVVQLKDFEKSKNLGTGTVGQGPLEQTAFDSGRVLGSHDFSSDSYWPENKVNLQAPHCPFFGVLTIHCAFRYVSISMAHLFFHFYGSASPVDFLN